MRFDWRAWLGPIFRGPPGRGKSRHRAGVRLGVEILEDRTAPSVNVLQNFSGLNYTAGISPPDTMLAVGPSSVLSAVNTNLTIQSKTGATIAWPMQFSSFFSSVASPGDFFSDPSILYDDLAGRFYVGVLEINPSSGSDDFDFAVSQTANPTDLTSNSWTDFSRITSVDEGGNGLADFPQMGWNADAVFVSMNEFPNNGGTVHDLILSIAKSALLSGTPLEQNVSYFQTDVKTDLGLGNGDHRILIPARMHGSQPGNLEYFVQQDRDRTFTSYSTVNVVAMQNYLGTLPTFTTTLFAVNPYRDSPGVRQLTGQIDDRMLSADWDNNLLVAAQDIGTLAGTPDNLARWYEFSTAGPAPIVLQEGDVNLGPGIDTSFPAIAINAAGAIGLTFIESGPNSSQAPSVYVAGQLPTDAPGTLQTPVLVQAGVAGAPVGQRGGDYAAAEYDPTDGTFWAANEYNIDSGSTDDWGVAIAQFQMTPGPNAVFVNNVYEQLLHRAADAGANGWAQMLDRGVAPSTVILDIEHSTEYLTDVVASLYQNYLKRAPDPGAAAWVNQLMGGASIEQVTAAIVGSPEYFALHGGTNSGFVEGLYQDVLGRTADTLGLTGWLSFLNNGGPKAASSLHYQAAMGFLTSAEYRTDLVELDYSRYLLRSADPAGLAYWVRALQAGLSDQSLLADLFGSPEGYAEWS